MKVSEEQAKERTAAKSPLDRIPASRRWLVYGALAGLAGGVAMGLYAMLATTLLGKSLWQPVNAIAAVFPFFRPVAQGFHFGPFVVGSLLHFAVAAAWGVAYAGMLRAVSQAQRQNYAASTFWGALFGPAWGLAVWIVMGLLVAPRVSPIFDTADYVQYLAGHLVYGMVTGWVYAALAKRSRMRISFAPTVTVTRRESTPRR